ncbi:hypothetical protein SLS62_009478 [Diatrype stigma]|uniref:Prenylcysteine lyase domain-containing protein n=1 Tax=Diatrype stigma TaxID=117547 RepID=A0AAN9UEG1_9PEZI
MTHYSGPGSNPTFWSNTGSRAGSPPPPYSPHLSKTSTAPPSYRSTSPPSQERTSLLGRHERVTVSWGTYSRETWEEWRRPQQRRQRARSISGLDNLLVCFMGLIAVLCFIGVIVFMLFLGWNLLRRIGLGGFWPAPPTYSVAIIGAGPAGLSAAHHLRNSPAAGGAHYDITLFEAGPSVGGKLAFFDSNGSGRTFPYNDITLDPITAEDIAGPALMWRNLLFTQSSERILRDKVEFSESPSQKVGYYSTERQFVVETTRPYSETPMTEWLSLILRYGSSVWHAGGIPRATNLREDIKDLPLWPNVPKILSYLNLRELAQQRASDTLNSWGISEAYAREILAPQVERGRSLRIPHMSGLSMVLAAAQEDSACKHMGGDFVERMEQIVRVLGGVDVRTNSKVTSIERGSRNGSESGATWLVRREGFGHADVEAFDRVIVAAPGLEHEQRLIFSHSDSDRTTTDDSNNDDDDDDDEGVDVGEAVEFDHVYVTLFTTSEPLRNPVPGAVETGVPPQVLFIDYLEGIHEVTYVREVVRHHNDGSSSIEHLYRYVTEEDISDLLTPNPTITWSHHRRVDYAYPLTYPRTRYPSFSLDDGLWTTGPLHSIGDTVDLSWLAGKIVAQQVLDTR